MTRRARGDRGALIIEAAFVFPIFLTLLFGIVDVGYAEFQSSQATAAARDGARIGILNFDDADLAGSANHQKIVAQVNERLSNQTATITVSCLDGLSGTTPLACGQAVPDEDRIQVNVSWPYSALTPVMANLGPKTITGTATMAIIGSPTGLPTTTTTTTTTTVATTTTTTGGNTTTTGSTTTSTTVGGSCAVATNGLTVSPALPLVRQNKNSTSLKNDTTFTVTATSTSCTGLKIQLPTKTSPTTLPLTFGGGTTWTITITKTQLAWAAGTNLPLYIQNSAGSTLPGGTFSVTVQ